MLNHAFYGLDGGSLLAASASAFFLRFLPAAAATATTIMHMMMTTIAPLLARTGDTGMRDLLARHSRHAM